MTPALPPPVLAAALAFLQGLDSATALDPALATAIDAASEPWGVTPEALAVELADAPATQVLDVRRAAVFAQARQQIPGARWCDPVQVGLAQALAMSSDDARARRIVYCVYGHAVSRAVVLTLRAQGQDVRFLRGGMAAWLAAGRPVVTPDAMAGPSGAQA